MGTMGPHVFHSELASPGFLTRLHAGHHKFQRALREQVPSIKAHPMARFTVTVGGAVMGVDREAGTQAQVHHVCAKGAHHINHKTNETSGVRFTVQTISSLLPQV